MEAATRGRILIVTRWFPPEQAPFGHMMNELAHALAAHGFEVDVITSVPTHPTGILHQGWRNRLLRIEQPGEHVRVVRLGALTRRDDAGRNSPSRQFRVLSFLWFTLAATVVSCFVRRPKVMFAVLQPLTVGPMLWLVARIRRARLVFNVQDLHPDALVALGIIRHQLIVACLEAIERFCYRRSDGLAVICDSFREHCIERGASPAATRVIPNWVDLTEIHPLPIALNLRHTAGLPDDAFVALYAGTIGMVSGAEVVIEAARELGAGSGIYFLFVGEGQALSRLQARVRELNLEHVRFLPFQPRELLNDVQSVGNVSLVTLLPGHGRTSVPSKVLGYLAAGRPVIASVDYNSETARFLGLTGAGLVVPPADPSSLAAALRSFRDDPERTSTMGRLGRAYLERHCSERSVLAQYAEMFEAVTR